MEMVAGMVELRLLSLSETIDKEGRRQRPMGNGPAREAEGSSMEVTVERLQVTPNQLHGLSSAGFQSERIPLGSMRVDFIWIKSRPSWFKEREVVVDNSKRHNNRSEGGDGGGLDGRGGGGMVGMEDLARRCENLCIVVFQ